MAKKKTDKSKSTTKKPAKKDKKDLAKKELTEDEQKRLDVYRQRMSYKPSKFRVAEGSTDENLNLELVNPDDPLANVKAMEAFGTADIDAMGVLINQVIASFRGAALTEGYDTDKAITAANAAMALLSGIQPQDEIEGMLAVQMIGVHNMAMEALNRAILSSQTFEGKQANTNQSTKMLRTFIAQMEALKKYRTGGQQKMVVEHVHVNEGGQAIVGTVNQGGGQK